MQIRSFEDITTIDGELASLFLRPDEAMHWIYSIENDIKDWIAHHNKQYWEIVRFVSEQRGILGKLKKDRKTVWLTRENFALVLLKFCPNALDKDETVSTLKSSMEHYEFAVELKRLDSLFSGHIVQHCIKEVEDLLDRKPIIESSEVIKEPTLEDLLEEYLRREVDEQSGRFPQSRVCIRPQYDGISPAISTEIYKSQQFLDEHRPSHIDAYEFVNGVLQKNQLYELIGKYYDKPVKLYIVSCSGLLPDVRTLAIERNIGYVLLNPHARMTSENYVLPRSIEDNTKRLHDLEVLAGWKNMTTPLLIMDGTMLTASLTDVLIENDVAVKSHRRLNIPFLSEEDIERKANELIEKDVDTRLNSHMKVVDLSLDPFAYATSCGLCCNEEILEDEFQLGRLDVERNMVTLNSIGSDNKNKYRFTMAHELGHHVLHSPHFKNQGVVSVGESKKTLSISNSDSHRLEYQANKFASFLLMPEKLVRLLYKYYFYKFIYMIYGDSFHALYYNPNQRETWHSYNCVVGNMASRLGVSKRAMEIRLRSLDLLKTPY